MKKWTFIVSFYGRLVIWIHDEIINIIYGWWWCWWEDRIRRVVIGSKDEGVPKTCIYNYPLFGNGSLPMQNLVCEWVDYFKVIPNTLNPSSPKGGLQPPPPTVFALVLKNAQQRGKLLWVSLIKFILSLNFSENISNLPTTPGRVSFQSWEVGGGWCNPWFNNLVILEIFEVICSLCLQVRIVIF